MAENSNHLEEEVTRLVNQGRLCCSSFRSSAYKTWRAAFGDASPEELIKTLEAGLSDAEKPVKLDIKINFEQTSGDVDKIHSIIFDIYLKAPDTQWQGVPNNKCDFILQPQKKEANLSSVRIDNQHHHIAKHVLREAIGFLKDQGYEKATLMATEVGSYAWAKYGFCPVEKSTSMWGGGTLNHLKNALYQSHPELPYSVTFDGKKYPLEPDEQTIVNDVLESDDSAQIWRFTECLNRCLTEKNDHNITVGKAILFGHKWIGALPLEERDAGYQRFMAYTDPANYRAQEAEVAYGKS